MGASNVALVYARWRYLPDHQFRGLVFMALRSLDQSNGKHPARLYFGGRDDLAFGLGLDVPDGDDEKTKTERAKAHRVVQRCVASLVKAGAVSRTTKPQPGRRQAYLLHLEWVSPTDTQWVSPTDTQMGVTQRPEWVSLTDTPRNHEEPGQEPISGIDTSLHTDLDVVGEPEAIGFDLFNGDKERRRQAAALDAWIRDHPEAS